MALAIGSVLFYVYVEIPLGRTTSIDAIVSGGQMWIRYGQNRPDPYVSTNPSATLRWDPVVSPGISSTWLPRITQGQRRTVCVLIPLAPLALAAIAVAIMAGQAHAAFVRSGRCAKCLYPVDVGATCPECGTQRLCER